MYIVLLKFYAEYEYLICANGSLGIGQNVPFLNKMLQSVLKRHILRYCKNRVCRTSNPKPYIRTQHKISKRMRCMKQQSSKTWQIILSCSYVKLIVQDCQFCRVSNFQKTFFQLKKRY